MAVSRITSLRCLWIQGRLQWPKIVDRPQFISLPPSKAAGSCGSGYLDPSTPALGPLTWAGGGGHSLCHALLHVEVHSTIYQGPILREGCPCHRAHRVVAGPIYCQTKTQSHLQNKNAGIKSQPLSPVHSSPSQGGGYLPRPKTRQMNRRRSRSQDSKWPANTQDQAGIKSYSKPWVSFNSD